MIKIIIASVLLFFMHVNAADTQKYSEEKLDQMLAPIALYPDALLSQILMATTFNDQLKEAIKYSKKNPDEKGDSAVKKVQDKGWDASVASLVAFPQVLDMLGEKPDWASDLGEAFLAEPEQMMKRIQVLRKKAKDAGNLESSKEQEVIVSDANNTTVIEVQPATQTVYVPVYNPTYVYGPWMYPMYPPYYYHPPYYNPAPGFIFGFSMGIIVSNCMWGGFGWHSHSVHINVNRYNKININKINRNNITGNKVNWNKHNQRAQNKNRLKSKDIQRQNAQNAMKKNGMNPAKDRGKLSGASGEKMRKDLKSNKFNSNSNAFKGINNRDNTRKAALRGDSSRRNMSGSRGSFQGRSHSGGSRGGFGGGMRGRR